MELGDAKYCDFVLWSKDELVVLRIEPDKEFIFVSVVQ